MKIHFWLFKKQKGYLILITAFLLAGIYGLYQGFEFKNKQMTTIKAFRQDKEKGMTRLVSGFKADTTKPEGKEAYENATEFLSSNRAITLAAYKMPNNTALFSIGQGDVFPYYYNVKVESFFMQLFKQTEIANPLRSLAGHFDTSFWIIYLLPLLIIVLGFNALSSE